MIGSLAELLATRWAWGGRAISNRSFVANLSQTRQLLFPALTDQYAHRDLYQLVDPKDELSQDPQFALLALQWWGESEIASDEEVFGHMDDDDRAGAKRFACATSRLIASTLDNLAKERFWDVVYSQESSGGKALQGRGDRRVDLIAHSFEPIGTELYVYADLLEIKTFNARRFPSAEQRQNATRQVWKYAREYAQSGKTIRDVKLSKIRYGVLWCPQTDQHENANCLGIDWKQVRP